MNDSRNMRISLKSSRDSNYGGANSIRGSRRIRKRTILGEKFDYGEKAKERRNYILYVSGQGQEKKEIEEIEELPPVQKATEKVVQEKEIIDNYQYHETKNLKRKDSRKSMTFHQRLSTPFERTKLRRYSSISTEPRNKITRTTIIEDKGRYYPIFGERDRYNSRTFTSKSLNERREDINSNIYEKYVKPKKYYYSNNNNIKKITTYEDNRDQNYISNYGNRISTSRYENLNEDNYDKDYDSNQYKKQYKYIEYYENTEENQDENERLRKKQIENNEDEMENERIEREEVVEEKIVNKKREEEDQENEEREEEQREEEEEFEEKNINNEENEIIRKRIRNEQKYYPQQVSKYRYKKERIIQENQPTYKETSLGIGDSHTETTRDGEYLIKVTIIKRKKLPSEMSTPNSYRFSNQRFVNKYINTTRTERRDYEESGLHSSNSKSPKSINYPKSRPFPSPKYNKMYESTPYEREKNTVGGNLYRQKIITRHFKGNNFKDNERYNENEGNLTQKYERNERYTKISQSNNNIRNNFRNIRNEYAPNNQGNKSYTRISDYRVYNTESKRFPGKGTRVGGSHLVEKIGLDSDSKEGENEYYSKYSKYEKKTSQTEENYTQDDKYDKYNNINKYNYKNNNYNSKNYENNNTKENNFEESGDIKEVFCPVHGRQIIRVSDY